jgi:uncharacterized protein (TIGR02271 family)
MAEHRQVLPGARVQCRDGELGVVEDVLIRPESGEIARLLVRNGAELLMVPAEIIVDASEGDCVRLKGTRQDVLRQVGVVEASGEGSAQRVPIYEERLRVTKEPLDLGELRLHKRIEREPVIEAHAVERDDLVVERVRLDRPIDAPVQPREENGWLVVPIMEEVLVISKQLVLAEEVRIRTKRVTEIQQVREELRRERVELEDATVRGVRLPEASSRIPHDVPDVPANSAVNGGTQGNDDTVASSRSTVGGS